MLDAWIHAPPSFRPSSLSLARPPVVATLIGARIPDDTELAGCHMCSDAATDGPMPLYHAASATMRDPRPRAYYYYYYYYYEYQPRSKNLGYL